MTPKLPITAPLPAGWRGFVAGTAAFMTGLKLTLPGGGMFRYAVLPVLFSLLILTAIAIAAFFVAQAWLEPWLAKQGWAEWLSWLGGALALVLALLVAYFLIEPVMTLLGPLFIDPVCERTHLRYTGRELIGRRSAQAFIRRQLFALVQSLQWLAVSLVVELPLAIIGLLTFAGVAVAGIVSAMIRGVDLMDYPHSCRHFKLAEKLKWCRRYPGATLGLGGAAAICKLVPGLNLFATVAGAAGATLLMIASEPDAPQPTPAQSR